MSLDTFFAAFNAATSVNPLADFERIWENRAGFEIKSFDGRVRLSCIRTFNRGNRDGSAALDWLCKLADEHQVTISGHIEPVGDKPRLNVHQLRSWYRRHGFSVILLRSIVRFPSEVK